MDGVLRATASTELSLTQKQVFKRQLSIINPFCVFAVTNTIARDLESLTYRIQMKPNYMRCESNRRNATFARETPHG